MGDMDQAQIEQKPVPATALFKLWRIQTDIWAALFSQQLLMTAAAV